jgi:hypothetical protein
MNETMDVRRSDVRHSDDQEAYHQMHAFMAYLPDELTACYREACRFVPELIEKESHPKWFLRYERSITKTLKPSNSSAHKEES